MSLSHPPPSRQNIWDLAVETLSPQDREHIDLDGSAGESKLEGLKKLKLAAEKQKDRCMAGLWKIQRKNKEPIILRDVIDKILVWVDKFIRIGDCAVQYDPVHAALPWAIIRFTLQIAVNDSQNFSSVLEGMEQISNLISRYAIFEELYLDSRLKSYDELVRCLTELYARVLVYLSRAMQYYRKSAVVRAARAAALTIGDEFESLLRGIVEKQSEVDHLGSLAGAGSQRENYRDLRKMLDDLAGPIDRINAHIYKLHDNLEDAKRQKILDWISTIRYSDHHRYIRQDRLPDSGLWLLQKEEYKSWRKSSSCSILWLHGIPGSGKSKLVSVVIDTLRRATSGRSEPLAYFYCARDTAEREREDPEEILRSILKQLSYLQPGRQIMEPVKQKYEELRDEEPEPRKLTLDESRELIVKLTEIYPSVTIVIDALDECNLETRCYLMNALEEIVLQSTNLVKVFVSSRDDRDIGWKLKDWSDLYIRPSDNTVDIRRFVDFQIEESIRMRKFLGGYVSDGLKRHLAESLIEGADGMFQWVSLQLQNLCSPRMVLEKDVWNELRQLPKTLNEIYNKIYKQISELPCRTTTERVLKWLLCAQRQLSTDEFLAAVSIDSNGVYTSVSTQQVLDMCCNFVILDEDLDVFRFAHLSVREFLEARGEYKKTIAHSLAAERCLVSCLAVNGSRRLDAASVQSNNAFRNYATLYWAAHCQMSGDHRRDGTLKEYFHEFVLQDLGLTLPFGEWAVSALKYLQSMHWDDPIKAKIESMCSSPADPFFASCVWGFCEVVECCLQSQKEILQRQNVRGYSGLYIASQYAQNDVVRQLLDAGMDAGARSSDGSTALHVAAEKGGGEIVQLLVEKGANVEARDENNWTALHWASKGGNTAAVQQLLKNRANVFAKDGNGRTALHQAAEGGNKAVVELLLQNKADVEAQDNWGTTALQGAAERGHEAIVLMLLEKGANVNAKGKRGRMALGRAVEKGHEAVVRLLLSMGADIQTKDGEWGPLHWAAERGNEGIVRLLLENGADVTTKDSYGMTPLHRTAGAGHDIVILQLLEKGANIEANDEHGCTALYHAAEEGRETVVKLLLGKEANVEAKSNEGKTSLHQAAGWGHKAVLRLLLGGGADVEAKDNDGKTPLHQAAARGHEASVLILLKNGADAGAKDNDGKTPLHRAAKEGHEAVLRLLLESGADVEGKDNYGKTSLHQAMKRGHEASVLILLKKGASVHAKDRLGRTALHLAARNGKDTVVLLFLEKGEDVNRDNHGKRALHWAAERGHKEVVRQLLEKGGNIEAIDNYGMTALHWAAKEGHEDVVKLLLEKRADSEAMDIHDMTPLDWATSEDQEPVVQLLTQTTE